MLKQGDTAAMKAAQCEGLQSEREKLQLSHKLELQAMPVASSKAARSEVPAMASQREESRRRYLPLTPNQRNPCVMGDLTWALAYKRGVARRLARTLEAELKAIAGAMDEGAIQSMWDSHPTLDSIRRRRRGERDLWPQLTFAPQLTPHVRRCQGSYHTRR